jgi:hypothetical protein
MAKHHVEAPIEKVKKLILDEWPGYYNMSHEAKLHKVSLYVKPVHQEIMLDYMQKTESEVDDNE